MARADAGIQIETIRIPAARAKQSSIPMRAQVEPGASKVLALSRSMMGNPLLVVEEVITSNV